MSTFTKTNVYTTTHRRYPAQKWDYKAISTYIVENGTRKHVFYSTNNDTEAVEIYQGRSYDPQSNAKSYSTAYTFAGVPRKYATLVAELKEKHLSTTWSTAERVELN